MPIVIQCIQNLEGVADAAEHNREVALVISSGARVWHNSDYEDGSVLNIQYPGGPIDTILTAELMPSLLADHAHLVALRDGGKEALIYRNAVEHFYHKTDL